MRETMRIFLILAFIATGTLALHAQVSNAPSEQSAQLSSLESPDTSVGVVIIDGDELGVTVVPNPTGNSIYIKSTSVLSDGKQFSIYDSGGNAVMQQKFNGKTIDVSMLDNGDYYLIVFDGSGSILGKASFIVQH
ncbi:MAG: T9SS type A sorting domain-containing protein [Chitinophagales bacterium]